MISVASYNIRKSVGTDWRRDPGRILDIISEIGADIIALQEVDRRFGSRAASLSPEMVADRTDYFAISFGVREQSLGWHGNTILYRQGIEVLDTKTLTLPALEPRGAVLGDFQVGKERLRVIGLHLGLVDLWRRRQAQSVLNQLDILDETLPTVIMGDLNQWTTEGGCLAHFAENHQVVAPGPSFHSSRPVLNFDRIITTMDIDVAASGVHMSDLARKGSDHLPVWARIRINAEAREIAQSA
ncbi:endonuclease/exonuclease/phosphatase family protein [Pelagibacterium flavum]|mgnify:FL=1|uniref:Endonuclease/exonuclease/phosphatase family protein n=1 Tax=Pelagibacterium flavum TaxID=2984530 RepID=A0ABY6IVW9_9HYPH|nr:endonuclease/exonuclease/phosphatase family protein [Pelagibacterium sp. YIM 151497]MAN75804.1 endonuclease [Hyphomicrobiales bacterium]UYQ73569.1 endonuclease/exonuclease/phosphatase family protein [Pelagibacterium sp. YIM 151497]|tara:strand:+ start:6824 stop:7549 length:726 start_codon:yes stop_codon:yes gene_type:complete